METVFDAVVATFNTSGSVYRGRPVLEARLDKNIIQKCRNEKHCIMPDLSSDPRLVEAVKNAIGSGRVSIKKSYDTISMPWDSDHSGENLTVESLLGKMHEEGWPGYDAFLEGVKVYKGTGRFGRPVYAICPITTGFPLGGAEVYRARSTKRQR